MAHGAVAVVELRAKLHPVRAGLAFEAAEEIHGLVQRRVHVARPEQRHVAAREDVLVRHAAEAHIEVVRRDELEARPALDVIRGRGRLVQLAFGIGEFLEGHPCVARLEESLRVRRFLAIDDVLVVQPRHRWHEHAALARRVAQAPDAVVAGAMLTRRRDVVVADDGGEVADGESRVGHREDWGEAASARQEICDQKY